MFTAHYLTFSYIELKCIVTKLPFNNTKLQATVSHNNTNPHPSEDTHRLFFLVFMYQYKTINTKQRWKPDQRGCAAMLQAWLLINAFVTCWKSASGCCAGIKTTLGFNIIVVSWLASMLSVQVLPESQSCVSSIKQLFLSWMHFTLYHCALVLSCNINMSNVYTSSKPLDHSTIFFHPAHKLKPADCSASMREGKKIVFFSLLLFFSWSMCFTLGFFIYKLVFLLTDLVI